MLKTRVITAAVLLAVFTGAWFVSLPLFETLMAAAFMAALGEWLKMLGASKSGDRCRCGNDVGRGFRDV